MDNLKSHVVIINNELVSFNPMGNHFMSILADIQGLHITARVKHELLLDQCKKKGVKFADLRQYGLKQAKKAGLHRKCVWDDATQAFRYKNAKELAHTNWYVQLRNFLAYANRNYRDYGVKADRIARANVKPEKKATFMRKVKGVGEVSRTEIVGATKEEVLAGEADEVPEVPEVPVTGPVVPATPEVGAVEAIKQNEKADSALENEEVSQPKKTVDLKREPFGELIKPTEKELTLVQKQQLILQNLDVLGAICKEKGAGEEFNILMEALEMPELMLPDMKLQAVG
jgi:hypothetical protein